MTTREEENDNIGFEFEDGSETDISDVLEINMETEDENIDEYDEDTDEEIEYEISVSNTESAENVEKENTASEEPIAGHTSSDTEDITTDIEEPADLDGITNRKTEHNEDDLTYGQDELKIETAPIDTDSESEDLTEILVTAETDTPNMNKKVEIGTILDKSAIFIINFGKKTINITKKIASKTVNQIKSKLSNARENHRQKNLDEVGNPKPKEKFGVKWHRYWFGDETHKVRPSSFKGTIARFYLKSFCGYVDLYTRMYDKTIDEIRQDVELIKKSKLPKEAVKLKGFKRTWDLDMDLPIRFFDLTRDDGFTASAYYNYARNNIIDDSIMDSEEQAKTPMNKRIIMAVVGILCFGMIVVYMYAMGMI